MLVREVMTAPAVTVAAEAPLLLAVELLNQHSITMLPVLGRGGVITGVLSEADVVREAVPRDPRMHLTPEPSTSGAQPHRVDELMNTHPITVTGDTDLAVAADLMTSTGIKSLPVVDDERRVVGVVSRRDIVRVLARPDLDIESELDDLFRRAGTDWIVDVTEGTATVSGPVTLKERAMAEALALSVPGVRSVSIRPEWTSH